MQPVQMTITHVNLNVNVVALAIVGMIGYFGYEIFRVIEEDFPEDLPTRPSKNKTFRKLVKRFL